MQECGRTEAGPTGRTRTGPVSEVLAGDGLRDLGEPRQPGLEKLDLPRGRTLLGSEPAGRPVRTEEWAADVTQNRDPGRRQTAVQTGGFDADESAERTASQWE